MFIGRLASGVMVVLVLAATLLLLLACAATAATRYAAPGGTGKDPCANPARPCSVFTAAGKYALRTTIEAGDVVELAPGTYRAEDEGEFGDLAGVTLPQGVIVRGEPGKTRPVIVVLDNEAGYGAFYIPFASEVADVAIHNRSGHGAAITVSGGAMERVIAHSASGEPACYFDDGTIRSSACISSGGSPAIGVNITTTGTLEGVIRNSTFIATGSGSVGMEFIFAAFKRGLTVNIDASGVLIEGEEKDVVLKAWPQNKGQGAKARIELRNSSYETVETEAEAGGRASVTRPGTNGNITASPLLADDYLHQLPGSPTIDKGAVDGASSALDIYEEPRTLGGAPDIGADEFGSFPAQPNSAPVTKLAGFQGKRVVRTPLRRVGFRFSSSDIFSRFECKLDRKPYRTCTSPYKVKVKLGKHEFRVRAIDPQGKADATPAVFRWRVLPWRFFLS
jgi:hypothetical protein